MEQLQEEVPEVREEEEEEEKAVTAAGGALDTTGGPDSSLPSSSYTGKLDGLPGAHKRCACETVGAGFPGKGKCLHKETSLAA